MSAMVLQLHGIARGTLARRPTAHPHRVLRFGSVCAIVSRCPHSGQFDDLKPEITAKRVMAHHEILLEYCNHAPVLPTQFGSFFTSIRAIRIELERYAEKHLNALELLADKKEYAVKLVQIAGVTTALEETSAPELSGVAFLEKRKKARNARGRNSQDRAAFTAELSKALHALAPAVPYHAGDPILHLGILVPENLRDQLQDIIDHHGPRADRLGLQLQATGPWPPYSFDADRSSGVASDGR